ncbi:MAG: putative quinol monooxygenase [Xenococcaceae cyanobacterium MO_188.B32]|nr:putative quinol monooxygenase [Xenococcaceae cyanobacterium MO_188.B32]
MSKETVRIVAHLVSLPEKVNELKSLLAPLIEPTRREKGCIQYKILQNREILNHFTLVEEWENQTLFEQHIASEHIQTVSDRINSLLAEKPNVGFYELV